MTKRHSKKPFSFRGKYSSPAAVPKFTRRPGGGLNEMIANMMQAPLGTWIVFFGISFVATVCAVGLLVTAKGKDGKR